MFGMLLCLFFVNWRCTRETRSRLPAIAAALALLWNVGSLVAIASGPASGIAADVVVAASFSVLSLVPAVLLHISLQPRRRALWVSGYVLSFTAVVLHAGDLITGLALFHYAGLLVVTIGFAVLTLISIALEMRSRNGAEISRLVGAMMLFLFAISFAHFGSKQENQAWSNEIALHHAGIPLAMFVLLQDYRFLLLDAFLRFVVNASLAAAAVLLCIRIAHVPGLGRRLEHPFEAGLLFVSACVLLTLFVYARNSIQGLLTRVIFLRSSVDDALHDLRELARASHDETEYVRLAGEVIARFVRTRRFELTNESPFEDREVALPATITEVEHSKLAPWVHAVVPFRFSMSDTKYLLLGARDGGRRYLSEDLAVLTRMAAAVTAQVEELREIQMQKLVAQAELKALQAQINPHFLFNSLNTLYGTIDRHNSEARQLVLDLSEVFRYLLRSERTFIEIEEELRIVRAYVAIEKLRLGAKLQIDIQVDDDALHATIPLLSIQPLVENAIRHGVASRKGTGFVRLRIGQESDAVSITVLNSGEFDTRVLEIPRVEGGIGLANVRRRLELCYGTNTRFRVQAEGGVTTVEFSLPFKMAAAV
jgi:two-component system LytT family sensor kinase